MSDVLEEYLTAIAVGDRAGALDLVRRLQRAGASPLEVMTDVIAPAQARVGELWATDAWSVAQEHAATAVSEVSPGWWLTIALWDCVRSSRASCRSFLTDSGRSFCAISVDRPCTVRSRALCSSRAGE